MGQNALPCRAIGARNDKRFTMHHRQPRADKLDAHQRRLCRADHAFKDALRMRVASAERFAAFVDGVAFYIALERPCPKCGDFRKRTRDRSCYRCHLRRGGENFERIRAGLAPKVMRSNDSHLDLLERKRAERNGECDIRQFGTITVTRWPTGRLEVVFPDGYHDPDLARREPRELYQLIDMVPELKDALIWAGWH